MSSAAVQVGVGTRFLYDGEVVEVVEMQATPAGNELMLRNVTGRQLVRVALRELLASDRARVIPDKPGPSSEDPDECASVVLAELTAAEKEQVLDRAAHVREVLTGYRSGTPELAASEEPRPEYSNMLPLASRYAAKAAELGVGYRSIERWVHSFQKSGEAGLAPKRDCPAIGPIGRADRRWVETALEVMVEHTGESKPSRTMVIDRANARVTARFGPDVVTLPSRATAFRVLEALEKRHPTFRLSAKRNRDIADRPDGVYGKLRPTRPGEYVLLDTTRLDVFALDPVTLRWINSELTVAMDWYDRCVVGLRLAPLPGEALDSWLEALAERLHTSIFDLFRSAGVTTRWNTAKGRKPWVHHLDTDQLAAVSTATGVPTGALAAMTLDRYAGTGLIVDRPARAGSRPRWWRGLRGSRFCPRCLADNGNRWMLSWRLAWSFACTHHHTLLLDTCPACGRRHVWTRTQPPDSPYLGDLGLALPDNSPRGEPPACVYSLAEADTVALDPDGPVMRAQHHVNAIITALLAAQGTSADLAPLQQVLDDLHAAARATLAALRTSTTPPESIAAITRSLRAGHGFSENSHHNRAAHVAFGTTAAHLMLATGPTAPDPVITDWLAHAPAGGSKARLSQLLSRWDTASPELQGSLLKRIGPRLGSAFQLRYGIATSTPRRPRSGRSTTRAASLPSLFWRGWALRLNPQGLFDPLPYRQALCMLLQIAGLGDLDYTAARALLGLPPASNAVWPTSPRNSARAAPGSPCSRRSASSPARSTTIPHPSTTGAAAGGAVSPPPRWTTKPGGPPAHRSAFARPSGRNASRNCT